MDHEDLLNHLRSLDDVALLCGCWVCGRRLSPARPYEIVYALHETLPRVYCWDCALSALPILGESLCQ